MNDLFIRENPVRHTVEVVKCPYDWIPVTRGKVSLKHYTHYCAEVGGAPLCIGSCCAIYPCERVRSFAEGRI